MRNRITAVATLSSFLVFCWSCYSIREIKPEVLATAKPNDFEIRKIEKTTGETVEYSNEVPGRVGQGQIIGTGTLLYRVETVEIDSAGLEIISPPSLSPMNVKTQDGKTYGWVKKIEKRGDRSVLYIVKQGYGQLFSQAISFSDIQKAWAKKIDIVKTLSLLLLGVGLYIGWPAFPGALFFGL